jgi:poly-gamma-glutamate capsule biosynthesis protein CapA/YwtB (metallophosphatase superfamily)
MSIEACHPIDLPRTAHQMMRFRPDVEDVINRVTAEALRENRWECSQDHLYDQRDPLFWAYWLYKTAHPTKCAMRGMGLEEYFQPYLRTTHNLRPAEFRSEREWTFSAVGDLMCTRGLENSKNQLYREVKELVFGADIAYANLESTLAPSRPEPLTLSTDESPLINVTAEQYDTLIAHGDRRFDIVQLANNHILDCGETGVRETLGRLEHDKIEHIGVNETEEASNRPRISEHQGLRIGWVAHTFSVNLKPFPKGKPWIVNVTPFHTVREPSTALIERQIGACRAAGCDLVFVGLHWGLEFECYPHPEQLIWAHRFAEAGADLILGHHPHVVQPVEIYRTADRRSVPILYSVGNLTPVFSHPATVLSLVARMRLARGLQSSARRTLICELELTPVAIVSTGSARSEVLQLRRLSTLIAESLQGAMHDYVLDIAAYADAAIGPTWRQDA